MKKKKLKKKIRSMESKLRKIEKTLNNNDSQLVRLRYLTSSKELENAIKRNRMSELADVNSRL